MKKKTVFLLIALTLIVLFIPFPNTYKDGGTKTYTALAYKIIKWNRLEDSIEGVKCYEGCYTYWFPDNFKGLDELFYMTFPEAKR